MRILALMMFAMDDEMCHEDEVCQWTFEDTFGLIVSTVGIIVALLGCFALHYKIFKLANGYWIGLCVVGILWNVWNTWMYVLFVQEEMKVSDDDDTVIRGDYVTEALITVIIPMLVWLFCWVRAYRFRNMIAAAEKEGEEHPEEEPELTSFSLEDASV